MKYHEKTITMSLINNSMCFVFSCLWFLLLWSRLVRGQNVTKKEYFSPISCQDQNSTVNWTCKPSDGGVFRLLPESGVLHDKVEYLRIETTHGNNSFEVHAISVFQNMKELIHLEISSQVWLFSAPVLRNWSELTKNLFNIAKLQVLIVHGTDFNSRHHSWTLPSTLKKLVLKDCDYTEFDLNCCPNLEYVDFSNNPLAKIPAFSHPPPPLVTLTLVNNTLYEFSVNDIAKLCQLKELQLGYHSDGSQHRNCECWRLQSWAKKVSNTTFTYSLHCDHNAMSEDKCKGYDLLKADVARDECLHISISGKPWVIIAIAVLISIAVVGCIYICYQERRDTTRKIIASVSSREGVSASSTPGKGVEAVSTSKEGVTSTTAPGKA